MKDTNRCLIEKITDFLIKVGEHCMECEEKEKMIGEEGAETSTKH